MPHRYRISTVQWLKCMSLDELALGVMLGAIVVTILYFLGA